MIPFAAIKALPWRYIIAALAVIAVLFTVEQYGENRIQAKWDEETNQRKAKLAEQEKTDKEAKDADEAQHKADIAAAQSQAGRDAIDGYVRRHGLRNCPGRSEANGSQGTHAGSEEQGTGGELESFATDCALDALHVLRWQEWARRQDLPVE